MSDEQMRYQRVGQEGSRWVNGRPDPAEVAKWFKENVPLHDGMEADDFITGVTLIPAKAKEDEVVGFGQNGAPIIQDRQNLYFVPYIKVETRVLYFWRLMEKNPNWLGVIEPSGGGKNGLPPGFFEREVEAVDGKNARFLCCSMRVRIFDRETVVKSRRYLPQEDVLDAPVMEEVVEGNEVISPPPGTKAVNVLGRFGPDENALMKAETGAIGRALGMAGILVLPGSGVATAEDMQDAAAAEGRVQGSTAAALPGGGDTRTPEEIDAELRERAKFLIERMQEDHPATLEEFQRWARSRKLGSLSAVVSPALKGVVRKLEAIYAEAEARSQEGPAAAEEAPEEAVAGGEAEDE